MDIRPNIIVCDCDGVLTDGKFWLTGNGEITKGFNTRDVRAIKELISWGYEFWIVTASSWPGMEHFAKKTGAAVIVERDKSKVKDLFDGRPYMAIGDDVWDVKMLDNAQYAFCPYDANELVINRIGVVKLKSKGGDGCIVELVSLLTPELPKTLEMP